MTEEGVEGLATHPRGNNSHGARASHFSLFPHLDHFRLRLARMDIDPGSACFYLLLSPC
jgi:hypothetical protein